MKKIKIFFSFIFLVLFIFMLTSCQIADSSSSTESEQNEKPDTSGNNRPESDAGDSSEGDSGDTDTGFDDKYQEDKYVKNETDTFFAPTSDIMFTSPGAEYEIDAAYSLISKFSSCFIDKGYAYYGYIGSKADKEIVLGYIENIEASVKAYKLLDDVKSQSPITESRYLAYASGGTVAIAYDKNEFTTLQTIEYVADMFFDRCIKGKEYVLFEEGVLISGTVNLIELQSRLDSENNAERWSEIQKKIGDEDIYLAFKAFFEQMFTDEIVNLIASYYDPATGLFYSSASGKRAEGIYPNPEATSMILSYVLNTGMLNGLGVRYLIPDLARYKIVYYLKSIQDENGEFYLSQMSKSSIDSNRLGRDRGACVGLLDRLGASPTYSVSSMIGDGIDGEEYWADLVARGLVSEKDKPIIYRAEKSLQQKNGSLSESVVLAVSKVVLAADGTSQFQSHTEFIKWLLAKDPYNSPYSAMSNTSSAASLISDWSDKLGGYSGENTVVTHGTKSFDLYKGETLNEILIRWMNSHINSAGLFGKVTNAIDSDGNPIYDGFFGGWGYQNSNGFFKAIGRYSNMKIAYPEPRLAAESLLLGINSDEPVNGNILVIYNVWSSLNSLRSNIKAYYTGNDKNDILNLIEEGLKKQITIDSDTGKTKAYAAVALEKCTKKILAFKKSDGGFGHAVGYSTPNWQGGLKVAVSTDNLSDIDAITCSSMSLGNALSELFGFSMLRDVPMNNQSDVLSFIEIMTKQERVIKIDPNGDLPERSGIFVEDFDEIPNNVTVSVPEGDIKAEILEKQGNNRLAFIKSEHGFAYFTCKTTEQAKNYDNTVVIGFDILVENVSDTSGIELYLQKGNESVFLPYFCFESCENGAKINVYDHKSGNSSVYSGINVGEWASVQVRYYQEKEKYDVYVNGSFIMSGSYLRVGTEYPRASEIDGIKLALATNNIADFYFDNLYFEYLCLK